MQSLLGGAIQIACRPLVRSLQTSPIARQKWKIIRLNHVAVATLQLEKLTSFYRDTLGLQVSEPVPQKEHGVTTVFVDVGNTKFELLLPLGDKSPIANFLEKNKGGGAHHVCLEVDDIEAAVADLKQKGIRMLAEKTRIGAHGKPVMFLHPKDCGGVLVELEQA
uniref:Methylmalonyl-CoA epimerase, mitochondrial n=2 Tax=Amblyomma TaxID=6942 RepID=G3MT71_AMBMU